MQKSRDRGEGTGCKMTQKAHQEYLLWVEANFGVDLPPWNAGGLPPPNPSYRDYLTEERARHQRIPRIWSESQQALMDKQWELEAKNLAYSMRLHEVETENQQLAERQYELEEENHSFALLKFIAYCRSHDLRRK